MYRYANNKHRQKKRREKEIPISLKAVGHVYYIKENILKIFDPMPSFLRDKILNLVLFGLTQMFSKVSEV